MRWLACACLLFAAAARAESLADRFPPGSGSRFDFTSPAVRGELVISIAASTATRVTIEYFIAAGAEMWQQFTVDVSSGVAQLAEGYLLVGNGAPERIPPEILRSLNDLSVADFLISSRAQLERYKKGQDRDGTRYQYTRGAQTITFWLSDAAAPIGLAKLESRGSKIDHGYALTLRALIKNAGRKIDPARAVPLSAEHRALLDGPLR
jgi:hypothetical protein